MARKAKAVVNVAILGALAFFCAACNNSGSSSGTLSCSASANIASGDITQANATIQLSNLTVAIVNGTGPFTISLPNVAPVSSSSATYTFPTTEPVLTASAGSISTAITVADTSNSNTATCSIAAGTASGTNGLGGTSVTSGILTATAYPSSSYYVGNTGIVVAATAAGAYNPIFNITTTAPASGVTVSNIGNGFALVTASAAASVTLNIQVVSSGAQQAVVQQTLSFTTGTPPAVALQCQMFSLGVSGATAYFDIATNTSETVELNALYSGEYWNNYAPTFPITIPYSGFSLDYLSFGPKTVVGVAQSPSSGNLCNGNGLVYDQITIY